MNSPELYLPFFRESRGGWIFFDITPELPTGDELREPHLFDRQAFR